MHQRFSIRIETMQAGKTLLPWVTISRRGRYCVESHCFALLGFNEAELHQLSAEARETARDTLEYALRLTTAFEYIPKEAEEFEKFFERKLVAFENRLNANEREIPPLHAAVGITINGRTLFATAGDIAALHLTESSIVNLGETRASNSFHFGTFHSGTLTPRTSLLFIPKYLAALLKSDELKSLATARASEQKLANLQHLLQTRTVQNVTFKALLLEVKPQPFKSEESTESSINQLLKTEATTEELLSPPLLKPFLASLKSLASKLYRSAQTLAQTYKTKGTEAGSASLGRARNARLAGSQRARRVSSPPAYHALSPYLFHLAAWGKKAVGAGSAIIRGKIQIEPTALYGGRLRIKLTNGSANLIERFNVLPFKSKILLIVALTLLFGSAQSVLLTSRNRAISRANTQLREEMAAIRGLIDTANASLIYNDEEKARQDAAQVKARLSRLPDYKKTVTAGIPLRKLNAAPTSSEIEELTAALKAIEERLRHTITIENPTTVLALAELPDKKGILFKEGSIFAYGGNTLLQSREGIVQKITVENPKRWQIAIASSAKNTLLLIDGATAYLYNYLDRKAGEPIGLRAVPIGDAMLYRKRLYTLAPQENQIYKYEPTAKGFAQGTPWVSDSAVFPKGVSIAVDGSVYVLSSDGAIIELRKGAKVDFTLKGIDPALSQPAKIWTDEFSNYLYILDPIQKRLIVVAKKDGALKAQYTSSAFSDLKDFAIDEQKKTAYLLDGPYVVSIPLSHFTSR